MPVDQHAAGAADPDVAALLGTGTLEILPQHVDEQAICSNPDLPQLTIELEHQMMHTQAQDSLLLLDVRFL